MWLTIVGVSMGQYTDTTKDDLLALKRGLEIISHVKDEDEDDKALDIYLYAMVNNQFLVDIAKEAIISSTEDFLDDDGNALLEEKDIDLSEIGMAIPLSADNLYALFGSGWEIYSMDFAFQMGDGEGVRTLGFHNANTVTGRVRFDELGAIALANGDLYIDEFFKAKGQGTPMKVNREIKRTEEATTPAPKPAIPSKHELTQADKDEMKRMGITGGLKLAEIVDEFLG